MELIRVIIKETPGAYLSLTDVKEAAKRVLQNSIALKFATSISPNRGDEDKSVDNADFMRLIRVSSMLDEHELHSLGELIYRGGGKELTAVVNDVKEGRAINLTCRIMCPELLDMSFRRFDQ